MSRRRHAWFAKSWENASLATGDNLESIISAADLHAFGSKPTITRIVGRLYTYHERSLMTASQHSQFWLGITCLHEDIGASTLGLPAALAEDHWMWSGFSAHHSTFQELRRGDTGAQYNSNAHWGSSPDTLDLDVRTMRKAPDPCELVLSVHVNDAATAGATHRMSGYLRDRKSTRLNSSH